MVMADDVVSDRRIVDGFFVHEASFVASLLDKVALCEMNEMGLGQCGRA